MTAFNDTWQRFDQRSRIGLAFGVVLIAAVTIWLAVLLLRTDYQVLFADLAPQDAATMTAELDKLKIPYRLSGDGNTILVPAAEVHRTRLKLVAKDVPLRGAVGLELFNSSEVGMTEFTQKVNYQRALQGELTRTILALEEVQTVRVHLVMAEQALFKKSVKQAKAAITIGMKPGRTLDPTQVAGIQRLVAASVPDIKVNDVTITDQQGVALTRNAPAGEEAVPGSAALEDKRAIETYLNQKIVAVLDRTFGAGQAIASTDVTLTHNHTKITTEKVLGKEGEGDTQGVMVREKMSSRDVGGAAATEAEGKPVSAEKAGVTTHEADYQVGRRVEQVVAGAGAIGRVNVAVVVRGIFDQQQLDRLTDVVALAAGINKARGDAVSVYSMAQVANVPSTLVPLTTPAPLAVAPAEAVPAASAAATEGALRGQMLIAALGGILLLAVAALGWRLRTPPAPAQLSFEQRRQLLNQVNNWLDTSHVEPIRKEQF